jgi:hypothetical protein
MEGAWGSKSLVFRRDSFTSVYERMASLIIFLMTSKKYVVAITYSCLGLLNRESRSSWEADQQHNNVFFFALVHVLFDSYNQCLDIVKRLACN